MDKILLILSREYSDFPKHYREEPFKSLIGTVLSQRTMDQTTDRVTETLFKLVKNPKDLSEMTEKRIAKIIKPVNFYKTKAKRIKQIADKIAKDYHGKVPTDRNELMKLPGVGPKTADCVLSFSYGKHVIPIDTHVEVVAKRLGIAEDKDDYHDIQDKINSLVSEKKRDIVNYLLVEHGKKVCMKHNPNHGVCKIRKYCRYYKSLA